MNTSILITIIGTILLIIGIAAGVLELAIRCKSYRKDLERLWLERTDLVKLYSYVQDLRLGDIRTINIVGKCVVKDMEHLADAKQTLDNTLKVLEKSTGPECVEIISGMRGMISTIDIVLEDRKQINETLGEYIQTSIAGHDRSMENMRKCYPEVMKEYDNETKYQ